MKTLFFAMFVYLTVLSLLCIREAHAAKQPVRYTCSTVYVLGGSYTTCVPVSR